MNFDRAWVLPFALLPLVWAWWQWRRTDRRRGLILKALCFLSLIVALSGPSQPVSETKLSISVLADTSASVPPADLERASQLASAINNASGRNEVRVIPFARQARRLTKAESAGGLHLQTTAGPAGRSSDLEAAVREAISATPADLVPRIAVISDGRENAGSVSRAAWQARELGIPVDTFLLPGREKPALSLDAVRVPAVAFSGERFPIELIVSSPRAAKVEIEIAAEGRTLGKSQVDVAAGANPLGLTASLVTSGVAEISGSIRGEGLGEVRFARAVALRRPKVLYVTGDAAGMEKHLRAALQAGQFDVNMVTELPPSGYDAYQLMILNNWDLEAVEAASKNAVEQYVKQGGGLLVIGGERNQYSDKKGRPEDPLERALPAKVAPPKSPEGTTLVMIIDKSSSMEGRKMELARTAAMGVVDNLKPNDQVAVLMFDNTFEWAFQVRKADDKAALKRIIAGILPDGGTQIAPALAEAYKKIQVVEAPYRHILLLTDGISEEGDSMKVATDAAAKQVTISTVGLGQDVNRAYLEKIADIAKGKSYFLVNPAGLEQILLKDVEEFSGSTSVEKTLKPELARQVQILEGVGISSAPALEGYVRFEAKPSAETLLKIDRDPLLARWQYGLGRSAVWASDAKARWASAWVDWKGFDTIWTNIARDLLPRAQPGEARLDLDSASGELVVSYRLGSGIPEPAMAPDIFVIGPEGFQKPVPMKKVASGSWRGVTASEGKRGLFRARPLVESRAFPEVGIYLPDAELDDYGSNGELLRELSAFTGGTFSPKPEQVFAPGDRVVPTTVALWPFLLGLAVLFNIAELVDRKWKGLRELFSKT